MLVSFFSPLRNRIVPSLTKRIAAKDPPDSKSGGLEESVLFICLKGILRAGRVEDTGPMPLHGGQVLSVEFDQTNTDFFHIKIYQIIEFFASQEMICYDSLLCSERLAVNKWCSLHKCRKAPSTS